MTVCLHCGARFVGSVDLEVHWNRGFCRKRAPVIAGELIEGQDGVLRVRKPR